MVAVSASSPEFALLLENQLLILRPCGPGARS